MLAPFRVIAVVPQYRDNTDPLLIQTIAMLIVTTPVNRDNFQE